MKKILRIKEKDNELFDQDNFQNKNYISRLYAENKHTVQNYLEKSIKENLLIGLTYMDIFKLIYEDLNLEIPN